MLCFQILSCLPAAGRYKEKIDGKIHTSDLLLVGDNYLSTLGCEIIEGRNFLINSKNDANESVIVNEDFIRIFHVKDPLNQSVHLDNKPFHIIDVVRDFMPYGLFNSIKPSIIRVVPERLSTFSDSRKS